MPADRAAPPPLVVVRLRGGLGNQLFQYAAGRRLALDRKAALKLDISALAGASQRRFSLRNFRIAASVAAPEEAATLGQGGLRNLLEKAFVPYFRRSVLVERQSFVYDANVLRARDRVLLDGFWQNEAYFNVIGETLRGELTLSAEPDNESRALLERIAQTNAVCVHVRRGDYVQDPQIRKLHGSLSPSYYHQAAEYLRSKVDGPTFYVFSDEPAWAAENLRLPGTVVIVNFNGPERDYMDLHLMRSCRHHIIANSSFSWWAAWLGRAPDQQVVAPARWMASARYDTKDLLPVPWHRI